jgi:uncharacterized Zn-binding protein involved in type VI secretion
MAARLGDSCAHGGAIVVGFPTVLIGGMPAARITDMHVCPMVTGVVPHVGGPIIGPGSPTVLIGGLPAVRVGDMATCVGPPDSIIIGCATVIIGMGGAGSGSGGGAGFGSSAGANAGAKNALSDNLESSTKQEHWIEYEITDKAGIPLSSLQYTLTDTEGKKSQSYLRNDGRILRDALPEGESKVEIQSLFNSKWAKESAKLDEKVELSVECDGLKDGETVLFQIWKRDLSGPDSLVNSIEGKVQGNKSKVEWKFGSVPENSDKKSENGSESSSGFSAPEYYFIALNSVNLKNRSGFLFLEDFIEIELKDDEDNPLADEEYIVFTPSGEIRTGKLNGSGYVKEEKISGGVCSVKFPKLPKFKE